MKKKKSAKKMRILNIHMYGIYDVKKNAVIKVSLDQSEIDMDMALMGGLGDDLTQCEFDVSLII